MRLAGGIAERKIREQKARRGGVLDDILGAAHHDGGNAIGFEMTRHQCRRLVTDRAVRDDDRDIDLVGLATREDLGRIDVDGDAMAAVGRRAEEARRDLADPPRGGSLQELRQRKPGAAVGRAGMLAIVADMRDAQIVLLGGVAVIDLVELGAAVVGRAGTLITLGGIILRGCRDDGYARLRERLLQRLERRIDIVRPAIGRRVADRGVIIAGPLHVGDRGIVVGRKAELVVEGAGHCCVSCVSTVGP